MKQHLLAILLGSFLVPSLQAAEPSRLVMDLASDTAWTLRCDDGPVRGEGDYSQDRRPNTNISGVFLDPAEK